MVHERPNWDQYFLNIAEAISKRADCRRRQVGAVLVSEDNLIIAHGYNGTRAGQSGCLSGACPRGLQSYEQQPGLQNYGNCIASHAEANTLLHATQPVQGLTIYINHEPCPDCQKLMFNAGLHRVVWPDGELIWP
jgi:dCMP deaminase